MSDTSDNKYAKQYRVKAISHQRVRMQDGVELCVKITQPDAEGRFPCILEYNPYRRIEKPLPDYRDEYPPIIPYLAERGYVVVQYDVRGTGNSGGHSVHVYSDEERRDGYDMVEWTARQLWSTGNVGMLGKSYGAVVQWQVAVQNPPHLKTIVVRSANDDVYTEWTNPGGAIRPYMFDFYGPLMAAYNLAPPNVEIAGEKWSEIWKERLEKSVPWSLAWIEEQLDGPYWQSRSLRPGYDRVTCPVFVVDGWNDWYPTALLRAFANLKVPRKAVIGPWGHYYSDEELALPGPRYDGRREYLRWFDYWLKGIDNGIMNEPPLKLFVCKYQPPANFYQEEAGFWRNENEWPLARTQYTSMYFHSDGRLGKESYSSVEDESEAWQYFPWVGTAAGRFGAGPWGRPVDQRFDEAFSLNYTTAPLEDSLELTGDTTAVLFVSSSADVAYFRVTVSDVSPEGSSRRITDGGLLSSHRNGHSEPEPMTPGVVYELKIELKYHAYVVPVGHRVRVSISSADFMNAWPCGKSSVNRIHRSAQYLSRIIFPAVPEQSPRLAAPNDAASPHTMPDTGILQKPKHRVIHDWVNQTTAYSYVEQRPENESLDSVVTISHVNTANVTVNVLCTYRVRGPGCEIVLEVHSITSSDERSFHHIVSVSITVDGRPYFQKSWSKDVPRLLN